MAGEVVAVSTVLAQQGIAAPGLLGRANLLAAALLNFLLLTVLFQIMTGMGTLAPVAAGRGRRSARWSVLQTVGVSIIGRQLEQANLVYGVFAVVVAWAGCT